jgi:putative ABC transport system substrate-binding protein
MRRRDLLGRLAAWPLAAPVGAYGQPRVPVVGFVGIASREADANLLEPFRQGLKERGYVEGRTVRLEPRYSDGDIDKAQQQFLELAAIPVDVFLAPGPAAARTLARVTRIPVVAIGLPDLESLPGLYASQKRPGGSVTGFSAFGEEMSAKRIQLLKDALPGLKTVGVMHNATDPTFNAWGEQTIEGARRQGLAAIGLGLRAPSKGAVTEAIGRLREGGGTALIIVRDFMTSKLTADICELGAAAGIAVVGSEAWTAEAGALLSYGPDIADVSRLAAGYVDRILKGEKPSDLPIQFATKFDFVVNLRTAKRLGLTIPPVALARADRTIE